MYMDERLNIVHIHMREDIEILNNDQTSSIFIVILFYFYSILLEDYFISLHFKIYF